MVRCKVLVAACVVASSFAVSTEAASASSTSSSISGKAAVTKVITSLEALLSSLEEAGRYSDSMFKQRKDWCDATLLSYKEQKKSARTSIDHLDVDLSEQQAAVEEAQGTLGELQAQAAMIRHTMQVTQSVLDDPQMNTSLAKKSAKLQDADDVGVLSKLVQGKTLTLASVLGEIEALEPALAELEAQAAESKRHVEDLRESSASTSSLVHFVKESCTGVVRRNNARESARIDQAELLEAALQSLEVAKSAPRSREVAFLQVGQHSTAPDELLSIFGDSDDPNNAVAESAAQSEIDGENTMAGVTSSEVVDNDSDADGAAADNASGGVVDIVAATEEVGDAVVDSTDNVPPHIEETNAGAGEHKSESVAPTPSAAAIKALISKVRSEGAVGDMQRPWCENELAHNQLLLRLALDAGSRAAASVEAHADMETQLQQDLTRVSSEMTQLDKVAKEAAASAEAELASLMSNGKEQVLASRILAQGVAVLRKLDATSGVTAHKLIAAGNAFQAQVKAFTHLQRDVKVEARQIREVAAETRRALGRERNGLVMARDSHEARRLQSVDGKATHDTEAQKTREYLNRLVRTCQSSSSSAEELRHQTELHLLGDVEEALEGRRVGQERSLRGTKKTNAKETKVDTSKLSPIERAAMEMGVPIDEAE
eukprot:TRINITY_DN4602_c0_g1_i1.p1 TRINITY_DN4602_c0_g1~~TRINITY_DN4602_c0_g1_i1.p1  ORF type:complete len:658 (+),score=152.01 TRINITY_DN4602_c0_g1_i1:103-2076(+)